MCVTAELTEGRRGASTPPEVGGMVMDTTRVSSIHYVVESPPEQLSPSHQGVFRDDLSPVTDQPASKRKIAINIGASPSGFILEEDEEEENDEELEVVDARMFRPIVAPQSSGDQPDDEPDEMLEHVRDLGGEGTGQSLDQTEDFQPDLVLGHLLDLGVDGADQSLKQPEDYQLDEVLEHVLDLGGEGTGQPFNQPEDFEPGGVQGHTSDLGGKGTGQSLDVVADHPEDCQLDEVLEHTRDLGGEGTSEPFNHSEDFQPDLVLGHLHDHGVEGDQFLKQPEEYQLDEVLEHVLDLGGEGTALDVVVYQPEDFDPDEVPGHTCDLGVKGTGQFLDVVDDHLQDYQLDEVLEHISDLGGEGTGQPLHVVIGQANLCDGPGEVSDDEGAGTNENLEQAQTSDMDEVPEVDLVARAVEDAEEFRSESCDRVVPDTEQLIDFDDDDEEATDIVGPLLTSQQHEVPLPDDDVDLPLPPPPPEDGHDQ